MTERRPSGITAASADVSDSLLRAAGGSSRVVRRRSLRLTGGAAANPVVVEEIDDVVVKTESQPATMALTAQRQDATAQQLVAAAADATASMSQLGRPAQKDCTAEDRVSPVTAMHANQSTRATPAAETTSSTLTMAEQLACAKPIAEATTATATVSMTQSRAVSPRVSLRQLSLNKAN
ncbi:hypothetical protein CCR75_005359 [Bremia lactucae]|uniref:Uncharacterized protein n=1 Tax=Bremia lactucae TaxID=4779 RepID=A0A976IDD5_BRELC|nr:hypothetical protein CCR75_005359 [Bremia lactucae]